MRVSDEPRTDQLRKKAFVLEKENERLSRRVAELQRQVLELQGMSPKAIELNLLQLCAQVTAGVSSGADGSGLTRPGHEGRPKDGGKKTKDKQRGHGPTVQPKLDIEEKVYDVDEPDRVCDVCGGDMQEWVEAAEQSEVIHTVKRKWVIEKATRKKYRCKCGGCVVTADGPDKLIKGGRYAVDVAVEAACAKYEDHIPLDRQVRMARREGIELTTQTLWNQIWALAVALEPLCQRIHEHLLQQSVIGTDLTSFKLIEKGGSKKHQVWQLSHPTAIYFEVLASKRADEGKKMFLLLDDKGEERIRFRGTSVMDGAAELYSLSHQLGFTTAGCWSHARRNVLKAEKEAPGQVGQFLDLVGELYDIDERAAREPEADDRRPGYRHRLDLDVLRKLRDTESRAVCDRIKRWILDQQCLPGGLLKAGLEYVSARWTQLLRFLDDPNIPLDNNLTEGRFVGLATGRRNYIGARSVRGTIAAARFYTVVQSAHVNGRDGEEYLRYAALEIVRGETPLLPHEWAKAR
ncbi:MAG: IS66 family transposase [Candidatus Limnocylindrus sp.]